VVAEGLDRLSREQAGVASLFALLQFHRVAIVTRAEGEISKLHVGLKARRPSRPVRRRSGPSKSA
jgi:site-specific DNA recombinase